MRVFKACLIIIKGRSAAFAIYLSVFIAMSIIIPMLGSEEYTVDFKETTPNFTIINRDGDSHLSDGLAAFLSTRGNNVMLEDRKDALQDASFYRATDFIAILPQGFRDAFWSGNPLAIETVATPNSATGLYVDMLVNQYLNQVRITGSLGGASEETAVQTALEDLAAEAAVEVARFGAGAPVDMTFLLYARFLCYIALVLVILCISIVTSSFRRPDLRMRNLCSPMRPRFMSAQQILCGVLFCFATWLLLTAFGFIIYGSTLAGVDARIIGLVLLNSFAVTIVSLSIASVICPFMNSPNAQNAAANFLGLGLCFLGGVFVPLNLFGEGMIAVSRFTPMYWYVMAVDQIGSLTSFTGEALAPIWQAMLTQLIFAAAFFCIALVVSKHLPMRSSTAIHNS